MKTRLVPTIIWSYILIALVQSTVNAVSNDNLLNWYEWTLFNVEVSEAESGLIVSSPDGFLLAKDVALDFAYKVDVNVLEGRAAALVFRAKSDLSAWYIANIDVEENLVKVFNTRGLHEVRPINLENKRIYELFVVANGSSIRVEIDGELVLDVFDTNYIPEVFGAHVGLNVFGSTTLFQGLELILPTDSTVGERKDPSTNECGDLAMFSLLGSQVGYYTHGIKRMLLRSAVPNGGYDFPVSEFDFLVREQLTGYEVYRGDILDWGEKWGTYWWVIDFSDFESAGTYEVVIPQLQSKCGPMVSSVFHIEEHVLSEHTFSKVIFDQLRERIVPLDAPRDLNIQAVWRGSGAGWATEISDVVITLHALLDVLQYGDKLLSSDEQETLKQMISFGFDYILASQRYTVHPWTDGWYEHDLNARLMGPAGDRDRYTLTLHDQVYALTALARGADVIRAYDQETSFKLLDSAKKVNTAVMRRPYNLESDMVPRTVNDDMNPYFVEASFPEAREITSHYARFIYNKPLEWTMPLEMTTREVLTWLWASTLLYQATLEPTYLHQAIWLANIAANRQFVNWNEPIDGAWGNFYQWPGDEAFVVDFAHNRGWHLGRIEPTNVQGFMDLIRLQPNHPEIAKWYNVVFSYAERYMLKTSELSPLQIYPIAMYRDREHGGVKFFQNIHHGATALYGQIARNQLQLAAFFNDLRYQDLAEANIQYMLGLNPGFPDSHDEISWKAMSLLKDVGVNSFQGSVRDLLPPPTGSGFNGFSAFRQFTWHYVSEAPDAPKGILRVGDVSEFQEDWLPNSMGYISAVALRESPFVLNVTVTEKGRPVHAAIAILLKGFNEIRSVTDHNGRFTTQDLPIGSDGVVCVTWAHVDRCKDIQTIGAGVYDWHIEVTDQFDVILDTPKLLLAEEESEARLTIHNVGREAAELTVNVRSDGVRIFPESFVTSVGPNEQNTITLYVKGGQSTEPFLIHVVADSGYSVTSAIGRGEVLATDEKVDDAQSSSEWVERYRDWERQKQSYLQSRKWWIGSRGIAPLIRPHGDLVYDLDHSLPRTGQFVIETDVTILEGVAGGIFFLGSDDKEAQDLYVESAPANGYSVVLDAESQMIKLMYFPWPGYDLRVVGYPIEIGRRYNLRVEVALDDKVIETVVFMDGKKILDHREGNLKPEGIRVGLFLHRSRLLYSNVTINGLSVTSTDAGGI